MKIIMQTLILLLCLQTAKAESFDWLVKLTIQKKDGSKTIGYMTFIQGRISKDSLNNTRYLINMLDRLDAHQQDNHISLFTTELEYKYKSICDQRTISDFQYLNEMSVQTKLIKKITVQNITEVSHYTEILNKLTGTDTAWMKTRPVKTLRANGDMCSYELYFHEYNNELTKLVAQLKAQSKKAEETGGYNQLDAIIKKITRFKVIVILNWTC